MGSLNQDLVVTVPRLPHPGETVMGERLKSYPGGKGANQAVATARLGGEVAMIGRVGNDSFGASLIDNLRVNGVDAAGVKQDPDAATGAALIFVEEGGQNMIAVAPGANARLDASDIERTIVRLRPGDVLVMQLEIPGAVIEQAVDAARGVGALILLNAAPAQRLESGMLKKLDVLIVNEREAQALADHADAPQATTAPPEATATTLRALGIRIVIVTLGAAGSLICDESGTHRVEPLHVQAIDSTGAGDAFVGALAVALAVALPPDAAVRFANAAGAAATTQLGAQAALPRPDDLRRLFGPDVASFLA